MTEEGGAARKMGCEQIGESLRVAERLCLPSRWH